MSGNVYWPPNSHQKLNDIIVRGQPGTIKVPE
jgi:hypothetical protein